MPVAPGVAARRLPYWHPVAGGTIRHHTAAERTGGPRPNGGQPSGPAADRRARRVSATAPREPAPSLVLLVAALGAAAAAVLLAIARGAARARVVNPVPSARVGGRARGVGWGVGGPAVVSVVWPGGRGARRLAMMVWFGWLTIGAAAVLQLALHEGGGMLVPGGDRVAKALALRLGVLLLGVAWTSVAIRGRPASRALGLALLVALTATWVY